MDDQIKNPKAHYTSTGWLLPFIWLLVLGCEPPSPIGEDFVENEIVDVVFTDTSTIEMSTILYDSVQTHNTERLLVGFHSEPAIGSIESQAFFMLGTDSILQTPSETAEYLFGEWELYFDDYYYYDTIQSQTLRIFQLSEELELNDDDVLYNTDNFQIDSNQGSLAEWTFAPRPKQKVSLTLPLTDQTFGRNLFELAQQDYLEFQDELDELLKGFVLSTGTDVPVAFLGFSTQSRLTLHYRQDGEDQEFPLIVGTALHFNRIMSDRNGTSIESLQYTKDEHSSDETNDVSYIQGGSSLGVKIELPGLRNMREVLDPAYILDAKLFLSPIKGTYPGEKPLMQTFTVFQIDKLNRIIGSTSLTIDLTVDEEFEDETIYEIDILPFVEYVMGSEAIIQDALLIMPESSTIGKSVDRLYVGDPSNAYKASVKIFVLDYII